MDIMMCGTSKAADNYDKFKKTVAGFGATPHFFTMGNIRHAPRLNSDAGKVSEFAVAHSDICVFIISEGAGKITWDIELPKADIEGIPIIIMASKEVMAIYTKNDGKSVSDITDPAHQHIVENTRKVVDTYGFSPTVYTQRNFTKVLREQLSEALLFAVEEYRKRNLRMNALLKSKDSIRKNPHLILKIAKDEMEDKKYRKLAIARLCEIGIAEDDFFALLQSDEQGVGRITAERAKELVRDKKPIDFYEKCFTIACDTDDSGLIRRLLKSLFGLDPVLALKASSVVDCNEIGTKRRVSDQLLKYAEYYIEHGLQDVLLERCRICSMKGHEQGWLKDIRDLRDRLEKTDER